LFVFFTLRHIIWIFSLLHAVATFDVKVMRRPALGQQTPIAKNFPLETSI